MTLPFSPMAPQVSPAPALASAFAVTVARRLSLVCALALFTGLAISCGKKDASEDTATAAAEETAPPAATDAPAPAEDATAATETSETPADAPAPASAPAPAAASAPASDSPAAAAPAPSPSPAGDPAFTITINADQYESGDRQRVTVTTPDSGWLYVGAMNADGGVYLYYPNPSMPNSRVIKGIKLNLPPDDLPAPDAWDINITLPAGMAKGKEVVFATLTKEPLKDLNIEWGQDQRAALTKAGLLSANARPGTPAAECFPAAEGRVTIWKEYDVTEPTTSTTPATPAAPAAE